MAPRRSSAARGARWGPGSPVSTRGGGARGRGTGAARDWEEGQDRPAPPHARSRVLAGGHLVGLRCGAGLQPPPPWPRVGPAGTELRGRVQASSRPTGHARRPPPPRLRSRWPCRRRKPRAAAHHGGCRGKDGGGAPRQGSWRGATASAEVGRSGEDGGGAPRRARSPGAAARMGAGCHGECGGGARRRVRRRSAAAARAKAEHSGELVAGRGTSGASAGREGGWEPSAQGERMGGRERKGWREEGEMHER